MASSSFSHIPRSWILYQSLLCIFGVTNISSIETLPLGIRVTSLLYHTIILTCTAPLFFMYYLGLDWSEDVFRIIERITVGLKLGLIFSFGVSSLINYVCGRKMRTFLQDWENYKENAKFNTKSTCVYTKWQRVCFVIVLVALCDHIYIASTILSVIDPGMIAQNTLPFLGNNTMVLQIIGSFYVYTEFVSYAVLLIMTLLYSNVIYTLSFEFVQLREYINNMAATSNLTTRVLASSRCHYEELAGLVKQCSNLFSWIIGSAMFVQMLTICSNLYMIITSYSSLLIWSELIMATSMLWMFLTPAIILTNAVSNLVIGLWYEQFGYFITKQNALTFNQLVLFSNIFHKICKK